MTHWIIDKSNKIRNIKLVPVSDEGYRAFMNNIKLERYHLRDSNSRSLSNIIAYPLEKTIREWANQTGTTLNERIISYEVLQYDNTYEKRFNEVDIIFCLNKVYYLVEVKVSSSRKALTKASNQLKNAYKILNQAEYKCELLIIHVNLNYKNSRTCFQQFNEDFLKCEFAKIDKGDTSFLYLQLKPHEVFEWGVKNGIILNTELLSLTIEETDQLRLKRSKRHALQNNDIPQEDWPAELKDEIKFKDEAAHSVNFGESSSNNILAEKLKEALDKSKR